jgi:hypothetical protein
MEAPNENPEQCSSEDEKQKYLTSFFKKDEG